MPLDTFTTAYVEAALWSTSAELGICSDPGCGADNLNAVLVDNQTDRCITCGGDVRGTDRSMDDLGFSVEDIDADTLAKMVADCTKFQAENDLSEGTDKRAGHDFWLTRNGHGAGFWDGDWPDTGDTLTEACKAYGEVYLYVGDDGRIYG